MAQPPFSMEVETKMFNKHIRQFNRKTHISSAKVIKKFAFDLLSRIVRKTPVDTGRARAGWYVAMEKLGQGSIAISTKPKGGRKAKTGFSTSAEAQGRAAGKFIDHTGMQYHDKWVEIINGVSYAIFLEFGHSKSAPHGMVRISMRELRRGQLPKDMSDQLRKDWNKFYLTG